MPSRASSSSGDPDLKDAVTQPDRNNLAPRVGLAYQITPKTVVRTRVRHLLRPGHEHHEQPRGQRRAVHPPDHAERSGAAFRSVQRRTHSGSHAHPVGQELQVHALQHLGAAGEEHAERLHAELEPDRGAANLGESCFASATSVRKERTCCRPPRSIPRSTARAPTRRTSTRGAFISRSAACSWAPTPPTPRYHSLQVTVQKRWSHGFTVLATTPGRSRSIPLSLAAGNSANNGPGPVQLQPERRRRRISICARLVVSGIWESPRLSGQPALVRQVLRRLAEQFHLHRAVRALPDTILSGVDNAFSAWAGTSPT